MIAVAPTYAQAGLLSPGVLLVARLIQGLSLGGEYGASATYLSEIADRKRRGFWSSFQYVTIIGGQLCALALLVVLQLTLGEQAMGQWGWRIGFAAGAVLAVVAYVLRRRLDETLSYENARAKADQARKWKVIHKSRRRNPSPKR
jgi:MHS family alpha-ketoglutarate permease-like MFS transporter